MTVVEFTFWEPAARKATRAFILYMRFLPISIVCQRLYSFQVEVGAYKNVPNNPVTSFKKNSTNSNTNNNLMLETASEWLYAGEGKLKIAFYNHCKESLFSGCILLVQKLPAANSLAMYEGFAAGVMRDLFPAALTIDKINCFKISEHFALDLIRIAAESRPVGRRTAIPLQIYDMAVVQQNYAYVYKSLPPIMMRTDVEKNIAFELKVKCGLKGSSPFIPNTRRIKLCMSRYQLMQYTKDVQASQTLDGCLSWGRHMGHSKYMPEDLCSGDLSRVRRSIHTLLDSPQNNLRISIDSFHCYGWDKVDQHVLLDRIVGVIGEPNLHCSDQKGCLEVVLGALARILAAESVLPRLVALQDLDVLDVEGAALVYARVVELLEGSKKAAQQYLEKSMLQPLPSTMVGLLEQYSSDGCETRDPPRGSRISGDNCSGGELPSIVQQLRQLRISEDTVLDECERRRQLAVSLVHGATLEECALLLQLFMVALVAKDASVVVAMQQAVSTAQARFLTEPTNTLQSCAHSGVVQVPCQQQGEMSEVTSSTPLGEENDSLSTTNRSLFFAYTVGVIDLGVKALDKLWKKDLEEDAVCCRAAEAEGRT